MSERARYEQQEAGIIFPATEYWSRHSVTILTLSFLKGEGINHKKRGQNNNFDYLI